MQNDRPDARAIFDRAVEIESAEELETYLRGACADDVQLRMKVEGLLGAYREAGSFLESPPPELQVTVGVAEISERPGSFIGRYRLLQEIGAGGFGVVFMAEQTDPVFRKVALKVIKPGMDSRAVVARFKAERQALAMMDHPNIAQVFDAGATEAGRPYFVMELVKGVPITEYCDKNVSPMEERLRLFVEVCRAVQHAHQKGVIHRDLKPSNIMVTLHDGKPVTKVIDFGVAKATHQRLTEKTLFTGYGQMVGTPQYMSPEQAEMSGLDVDTRSDVYSLGILLYELLTGTTPLDAERLRNAGYAEIQRIICEEEPQRPSLRLTTNEAQLTVVAKQRGVDSKRLPYIVRGELDWITMKSLEKERSRRYESAASFADDVERYLKGEAVEACPPSTVYRLRKLVRRHRHAVVAAGAVLTLLTVMIVGAIVNERAERIRAEQNAEIYRRLSYQTAITAAEQAFEDNYLDRTLALLDGLRPKPGQTDLRGFEWFDLYRRSRRLSEADCIDFGPVSVDSIAESEDATLAVATSESITLRRAVDGEVIRTIHYPIFAPNRSSPGLCVVAISKNGKMLAYNSRCFQAMIVERLDEHSSHQIPVSNVRTASLSPDASLLATGNVEGRVELWDVASGKKVRDLAVHKGLVWSVAYSPNGDFVASGGEDNTIQLSRVDGSEVIRVGEHFATPSTFSGVFSVAFSPDGIRLASGGADRTARIWNLAERRLEHALIGHKDEVRSVAFSPSDGQLLAAGGRDQSVRVWDAATGRLRSVLKGHDSVVRFVAFSCNGERLYSASHDGTVRVWERRRLVDPDLLWCNGLIADVAVSGDGRTVAAIESTSSNIRVWSLKFHDEFPTPDIIAMNQEVVAVAISSNNLLAAACRDGSVHLLGLPTRKRMRILQDALGKKLGGFLALVFSQDGSALAAGYSDGTIVVWDVDRQTHILLRGNAGGVTALAFSRDATTLVSGGEDKIVKVFDLANPKMPPRDLKQGLPVSSVAVSIDDTTIASTFGLGSRKGTAIHLWDAKDGHPKDNLSWRAPRVISFLDEQTMIFASDRTLRLWDLAHAELRATLSGPSAYISCMEASTNGQTVVAGSAEGMVRVWRRTAVE